MSECNCRVCTDHRKWLTALNPQTSEAKAAFDDMCSKLEAYSVDAVYWRMKYDGTWNNPSGAEGGKSRGDLIGNESVQKTGS